MNSIEKRLERLEAQERPLICYGGFYVDDGTIAITLTTGGAGENYYPITSGMTTGTCKRMTFESASQLKVLYAGLYHVVWTLTGSVNESSQVIEGVVMAGAAGNTVQAKTIGAAEMVNNGIQYILNGNGWVTCAVNDIIRLGLENETSSGKIVTIRHANLTIWKIE
jgi:hypothetical protein